MSDFDRPLNARGRKNAQAMAEFIRRRHLRPAIILCSAAARTRATLDILEPALEGVPVSFEQELYEAGKHDLAARLRRLDDHLASVMLIGHNPGLERLCTHLAAGHGDAQALSRLAEKFPTGTLAVLEARVAKWAQLDDGTCRLVEFVRPGDV